MSDQFALIVHACDRYELLFKGHEYFFKKFWDSQVPVNCYFATEEKKVSIEGFTNIHSGKGEWSDRLRTLLEKIPEQYVLYMQEDMWLNKPVSANFFQELFVQMQKNQWPLVKLHSSHVYQTISLEQNIQGHLVTKLDNDKSQFLMSHQISLWDKNFFINQLQKSEHPWRNERRGTKRLKKLNPQIIHIDYFSENGQPPINHNLSEAVMSGYATVSLNATLNHESRPMIDFMLNDSSIRDYAELCDERQKNQITHDGRPKPQKKDIFKRTKDYLKEIFAS